MIEAHCSCVTPLRGENTAGHEQTEKCHLLRGAPADVGRMLSSHLKSGRDRVEERERERENKNQPACQSKYVPKVAADAGAFSWFSRGDRTAPERANQPITVPTVGRFWRRAHVNGAVEREAKAELDNKAGYCKSAPLTFNLAVSQSTTAPLTPLTVKRTSGASFVPSAMILSRS